MARGGFLARLAHLTGGFGLPVPSAEDFGARVRQRVEDSIHELARSGGGVILGRGSAVVLADHPRAFHVRLDGPEHRRLARATAPLLSETELDPVVAHRGGRAHPDPRRVSQLVGGGADDQATFRRMVWLVAKVGTTKVTLPPGVDPCKPLGY